jgi:hypothetical protein
MNREEAGGIVAGMIGAMKQNYRRAREAEDPAKARARLDATYQTRLEFFQSLIEKHTSKENRDD